MILFLFFLLGVAVGWIGGHHTGNGFTALARARWRQQRRVNVRVAELVLLGFSQYYAKHQAEAELHNEARRDLMQQEAAMRQIGVA